MTYSTDGNMRDTLWLDLRGQAREESGLLMEHHGAYRQLGEPESTGMRMAVLVRGSTHTASHTLPYYGQVQLRGFPKGVICECSLHLVSQGQKSHNIGPLGMISQHLLPASCDVAHVSRLLYSQVLSLTSSTIVFIEEEYGEMQAVLHELAVWIDISPPGLVWNQPQVIILTTQRPETRKFLERQMTLEILTNFNALKELNIKTAEIVWRRFFSGIQHITYSPSTTELSQLIIDSSPVIHQGIEPYRLIQVLQAAFRQFHLSQEERFGLTQVVHTMRYSPTPTEFPIQDIIRKCAKDDIKLRLLGEFIASVLVMDWYHLGSLRAFPADTIFDEYYTNPLRNLVQESNLKSLFFTIQGHFKTFAAGAVAGSLSPLVHHQILLKGIGSLDLKGGKSVCLSCLSRTAYCTFSCGHKLCDACVDLQCLESNGQSRHLPNCVFCGVRNKAQLHIRPRTAGTRVLRLAGSLQSAGAIANFLRKLRLTTEVALSDQFDLVIASGAGIFFAAMLFCKRAAIEDCIDELPYLGCIKASRWGLKFGSRVRFRHDELVTNGVRLVLHHKRLGYTSPEIPPLDHQSENFWSNSRDDVLVSFDGDGVGEQLSPPLADGLTASLFYIELEDPLCTQVLLSVLLKCRLPPGPDLVRVLKSAQRSGAQIQHGNQTLILCSEADLQAVLRGDTFARKIQIPMRSINIDITINGIVSSPTRISNCPYPIKSLIEDTPRNRGFKKADHKMYVTETIDYLKFNLEQYLYIR